MKGQLLDTIVHFLSRIKPQYDTKLMYFSTANVPEEVLWSIWGSHQTL